MKIKQYLMLNIYIFTLFLYIYIYFRSNSRYLLMGEALQSSKVQQRKQSRILAAYYWKRTSRQVKKPKPQRNHCIIVCFIPVPVAPCVFIGEYGGHQELHSTPCIKLLKKHLSFCCALIFTNGMTKSFRAVVVAKAIQKPVQY